MRLGVRRRPERHLLNKRAVDLPPPAITRERHSDLGNREALELVADIGVIPTAAVKPEAAEKKAGTSRKSDAKQATADDGGAPAKKPAARKPAAKKPAAAKK